MSREVHALGYLQPRLSHLFVCSLVVSSLFASSFFLDVCTLCVHYWRGQVFPSQGALDPVKLPAVKTFWPASSKGCRALLASLRSAQKRRSIPSLTTWKLTPGSLTTGILQTNQTTVAPVSECPSCSVVGPSKRSQVPNQTQEFLQCWMHLITIRWSLMAFFLGGEQRPEKRLLNVFRCRRFVVGGNSYFNENTKVDQKIW